MQQPATCVAKHHISSLPLFFPSSIPGQRPTPCCLSLCLLLRQLAVKRKRRSSTVSRCSEPASPPTVPSNTSCFFSCSFRILSCTHKQQQPQQVRTGSETCHHAPCC